MPKVLNARTDFDHRNAVWVDRRSPAELAAAQCEKDERLNAMDDLCAAYDGLRGELVQAGDAARQDADTIEALRRTLDSVRSDRDASDAEMARLTLQLNAQWGAYELKFAMQREEIARLKEALGKISARYPCATADDMSRVAAEAIGDRAALACRPQGEPVVVENCVVHCNLICSLCGLLPSSNCTFPGCEYFPANLCHPGGEE